MRAGLTRYSTPKHDLVFMAEGGEDVACCFVIPNEALSSCLLSCGWEDSETFVWYVWVIDPTYKLDKYLKGNTEK